MTGTRTRAGPEGWQCTEGPFLLYFISNLLKKESGCIVDLLDFASSLIICIERPFPFWGGPLIEVRMFPRAFGLPTGYRMRYVEKLLGPFFGWCQKRAPKENSYVF